MKYSHLAIAVGLSLIASVGSAKQPSDATKKFNQSVQEYLPFADQTDYENAKKGFIATLEEGQIKNAEGGVVYDMKQFAFLKNGQAETANPSLWRQSQLNALDGLFKVTDGIYQVRGFDLANISFIRGKKGW
ncbi:MAG: MBL fold metallo-hydrolase, partial [Gammaproteobacteria bacterium]